MLYICIPAYNEAPTIGVLLWRIRKVFQEYSREYEVVVFNDGSADATDDTLRPYAEVLPLTVIGGKEHRGYAAAVDALCRHVAGRSGRYARRDAMILMQGDFTDRPEALPELVKRFEGGADVVVAERAGSAPIEAAPLEVRRLQRVAPWVLKPFVKVPGVRDPFGSYRLLRVAVVKDMLKHAGDGKLVAGDGWAVNVDLLLRALPFTRRVETIEVEPRYDLRPRTTRVRPFAAAMELFRFGREARRRPVRPAIAAVPPGQPS